MNGSDAKLADLDGDSRLWIRIEDGGGHPECSYRLTGDGQVEVLALGAHVVVPIDALPLLPEPIARAVLTGLAERVGSELERATNPDPVDEER